ncbi:hypothetical protein DVH05_000312 [Phytophthora capsici]|nr:hypothetical protein DVH05_025310 [Phytophthora capsici]KAG1712570.1 hypothetical protein DVH05_000312 [Phytophthora capsici]
MSDLMDDAFLHEVATLLDSDPLVFPEVDYAYSDEVIARSDNESNVSNDKDQEDADNRVRGTLHWEIGFWVKVFSHPTRLE